MRYYLTSFLPCTARIISLPVIYLSLIVLCLEACGGTQVKSLKLSAFSLADSFKETSPDTWPSEWKIDRIEKNPDIYKISQKDSEDKYSPAYATVVSECGLGKRSNTIATTRQLLVGLENIKTVREENFFYDEERIFFKEMTATLDTHDLHLVSFSSRQKDCVYDSIVWSDDKSENSVMDWLSKRTKDNLPKAYFAFSHKQ